MLNLNKNEQREIVLINEPGVDLHVQQQEGSLLRVVVVNLLQEAEEVINNTIHVDQVGADCRTEIYALAYVNHTNHVRMHTRMHHDTGKGESKQVIKFVLTDHAKGTFLGEMKIQPHAQKVSAEQTNRNLLLSDKAVMRTQPQLEIYADDVKASHGASTGQLDESALFYMQQRGLDTRTARHMLVTAFMKEITDEISDENKRDELLQAIDGVIE